MELTLCLACNKPLKGRSDKKFCDAQCRSIYHNKNRAPHEMQMQEINKILRKNRGLLAQFCPSGKSTVKKSVLHQLGFSFIYFTDMFPFKTGTYFFCYDYGYLPIQEKGQDKLLIIQKQDYMSNIKFNPWSVRIQNLD
ncbi:hypothetical protein KFZ70_14995 [Tamlana fucoidanivorans]|uniref:DUF2116 family Zn-ribbon domain-containing protein n=1 Tax=Allotamlana fucoidanivorans TaxID=2583814 RepID=A0A5C4SG83_9FLAO|nr:hypothetical protein [Tamlana fucoidanivorans]TNJ42476.1 hypothetical protein FGF67_14520 [Tamlana fucoidanivorans]